MTTFRTAVLVSIAALLALVAASSNAASPASATAQPVPVAKLTGRVVPRGKRLLRGTPIRYALDARFTSRPPGTSFVLRRLEYVLPRSIAANGRRFPSCRVRTLRRARGLLTACPKGSRIGRGTVSGFAVTLGVRPRARLTLFNGPGGRSITVNVSVKNPAMVNTTVSAPFRARKGRGARKLTFVLPPVLRTVLDSDITTSRIRFTIGATRRIRGVKRGYLEARRCPSRGNARIRGEFSFVGARAKANANVAC